jgi:serine-type D-Ala-D-Ala carboxypeptidase/endopeptidase
MPSPRPLPANWQLPSNEAIEALIAARNAPRAGQGIVVGVLAPDGRRIVNGGSASAVVVDGSTLFEIASISKIFTALILADMANKGEVSLDDPAAKYLPTCHRMPERNGRQITLRDLATHRSGLPRMADDMRPIADPDGPFADYTEARLLAFLDRYQLPRDIGSQWEYSNLGVGLLGYLLGRAAGSDYETLVRERITTPLGMDDTMVSLSPPYAARLAVPHDAYMQRVRPWDLWGVLAGAGGLRSSVADILEFAAAVLDPNSPIAQAVKTTLAVRVPGEAPAVEQALGWQVARPEPGREVLLHGGETAGFRATLGLEPARGHAVIVFANSAAEPSTADLMFHMLLGSPVAPTPPVPPAPLKRTEISLPAADLEKFVGRYDFGPGFIIAITREGGTLRGQREDVSGAPALQIFPEAPLSFFWKDVDAQLRFATDAGGAVTGAAFTQGELSLMGRRIGR